MKVKGSRFGEVIRNLRRAQGKTLQEMADKLDVSVSYYSEVELSKRAPFKAEKIRILAHELGGNFEELFKLAWADKQVVAFNTKDFSPQVLRVLQSFARGGISDEKMTRIENMLTDEEM